MTLIKELQIKITMSNYNQRISSYSSNYDYLFLDNLWDSVLNIVLKRFSQNLEEGLVGLLDESLAFPPFKALFKSLLLLILETSFEPLVGKITESSSLVLSESLSEFLTIGLLKIGSLTS